MNLEPWREIRSHEPTMLRRSAAVAFALPCIPARDARLAPSPSAPFHQKPGPKGLSHCRWQGALGDRTWSTATKSSERVSFEGSRFWVASNDAISRT